VTNVDLGCLRQDPRYLPMVKQAGLEPYLRNWRPRCPAARPPAPPCPTPPFRA